MQTYSLWADAAAHVTRRGWTAERKDRCCIVSAAGRFPSPSCSVGSTKRSRFSSAALFLGAKVRTERRSENVGDGGLCVGFAPPLCDGSAKYFLAVLIGHPDKQSAALFALDACEFRGDLTSMRARIIDCTTRLGFLIVDFGMVAQMEVKAVH
jgi:hypothetical protein